jgi:TonB-dependent SusC/RagA subfamily outer membrane receptor
MEMPETSLNKPGGRDGGDGIQNINPRDIESISVLKGANAAALCGERSANGVIPITTTIGPVINLF